MEAHWPVRLLTEMDLEDADLQGVRVLVLPNAVCLSDRAVEVGSATAGVLPVSTSIEPSLWEDMVWCRERTRVSRRACAARRGKISQISIPGTAVRVGRKGPRYSLGAFGLGSKVSN